MKKLGVDLMSLKTKDNNEDRIIILNNYLASLINTKLAEMGIVHNRCKVWC